MGHVRSVSLVVLVITIGACSSQSSPPDGDAASDEAAIAQLETDWSDMFGARDLNGITALLARNTVLIMPGSEPIVGAANVRVATDAMLSSDDTVSWASDFAFVAPSGDMAYDYGTATTKRADGSMVQGRYLVVWVKEDGQWKVAADMFN